jgi:GTP-dependent phosphoenolpyruvate carboxykinase
MKEIQMNGARTHNGQLLKWIQETARLCQPDEIHTCDGSQEAIFQDLILDLYETSGSPLTRKKGGGQDSRTKGF